MASSNLSEFDQKNIPYSDQATIGIVVSEWNQNITENLFKGAKKTLQKFGVRESNIHRWDVPGSFELVYGAAKMQKEIRPDGIIAIGSLIRGETSHFDYIAQAVSQGIKDLNRVGDIPTVFCVLTDDNERQAIARSGGALGNKGVEAAVAVLKMIYLGK